MKTNYHDFNIEDNVDFKGGNIVMNTSGINIDSTDAPGSG